MTSDGVELFTGPQLSEAAHAELHSSIFLILCPICGYEPPWSEDMVEILEAM